MRDAIRIADKAGRFGPVEFDEISLRSELRRDRPYEKPSDMIRRVTAELHYLREHDEAVHILVGIRRMYL